MITMDWYVPATRQGLGMLAWDLYGAAQPTTCAIQMSWGFRRVMDDVPLVPGQTSIIHSCHRYFTIGMRQKSEAQAAQERALA